MQNIEGFKIFTFCSIYLSDIDKKHGVKIFLYISKRSMSYNGEIPFYIKGKFYFIIIFYWVILLERFDFIIIFYRFMLLCIKADFLKI